MYTKLVLRNLDAIIIKGIRKASPCAVPSVKNWCTGLRLSLRLGPSVRSVRHRKIINSFRKWHSGRERLGPPPWPGLSPRSLHGRFLLSLVHGRICAVVSIKGILWP